MLRLSIICWTHQFLCTSKCQKYKKLMKIVYIDGGNIHISWTACGFSMKFTVKVSLTIILKSPKNPGLQPFSKRYSWGRNTVGEGGGEMSN